ncbi:hypothetical protein RhiTH_006488 [Rhizoctonia solani]
MTHKMLDTSTGKFKFKLPLYDSTPESNQGVFNIGCDGDFEAVCGNLSGAEGGEGDWEPDSSVDMSALGDSLEVQGLGRWDDITDRSRPPSSYFYTMGSGTDKHNHSHDIFYTQADPRRIADN